MVSLYIWYNAYLPLLRAVVEALDLVDGGHAVEAADGEHHVIYDLYGEVATSRVHVRHWGPLVSLWAVLLPSVHSRHAVKTTWQSNQHK